MLPLGVLGTDMLGDTLYKILQDEGIATDGIAFCWLHHNACAECLSIKRGNMSLSVAKQSGANVHFSEFWRATLAGQCRCTFSLRLYLARTATPGRSAAHSAICTPTLVVFDPGPFAAQTSFALKQAVLEYVTLLVLTEAEIPLINQGAPDDIDLVEEFHQARVTPPCSASSTRRLERVSDLL